MGHRKPSAETWWLYIDESGDKRAPTDEFVVVGLLVSERAAFATATLREALRVRAPYVPWPMPGWLLRRPAMHVAWASRRPRRCPPHLESHMRAADELLQREAKEAYRAICSAAERAVDPDGTTLHALDAVLAARQPGTHAVLQSQALWVWSAMKEVLTVAAEASPADAVFLVTGAESRRGDAVIAGGDRYLTVIEQLLDRVVQALCVLGGRHQLNVSPQRLRVFDPATKLDRQLHPTVLAPILARITGAGDLRRAWGAGGVRVCLHPAVALDRVAPPPHVLVDHVAGRVRGGLSDGKRPLETVLHRLSWLGPAPETRGLPLVATSGVGAAIIAQARAGATGAPIAGGGARRWALEQARASAQLVGDGVVP